MNRKSFGSIILSLLTWFLIVLITINFVRMFISANYDFKYNYMSFNSFIDLINDFIENLNVESFFVSIKDAFTFDSANIDNVVNTPISDLILNSLEDIGELLLLPIHLILFIARFIISIFDFVSTFFMYSVS